MQIELNIFENKYQYNAKIYDSLQANDYLHNSYYNRHLTNKYFANDVEKIKIKINDVNNFKQNLMNEINKKIDTYNFYKQELARLINE